LAHWHTRNGRAKKYCLFRYIPG